MDYGLHARQPELSSAEMTQECLRFLDTLQVSEERQIEIVKATVGQFDNTLFKMERANRLTASQFGSVIKRRDHTPCHALVKSTLYLSNFTNEATEYGKINESVAISLLEDQLGVKVNPCGIFIDLTHPFLGASPDGNV